jgi:hypothetical protein
MAYTGKQVSQIAFHKPPTFDTTAAFGGIKRSSIDFPNKAEVSKVDYSSKANSCSAHYFVHYFVLPIGKKKHTRLFLAAALPCALPGATCLALGPLVLVRGAQACEGVGDPRRRHRAAPGQR